MRGGHLKGKGAIVIAAAAAQLMRDSLGDFAQ
jgi:hypothetical protein